ncbi:MAG: YbaB/EbfC family nucleoid-associated protein [Anaerolineae bacterium]|nr:YbaB/EbfC family nucleoid-associated protein [Anaerolineae bacterium]
MKMPGRQGGAGGLGNLMQQAQKMQADMAKAQEELADETVEVTAGGGMVTIVITGQQQVRSITLKPEVVDPDDIDMLQDVLVAAVNQAIEQSQAMAASRLEGLTGGLNLPGFPGF